MKIFKLKENIPLFCVTAPSFPDGISEAFQQLISKLPTQEDRTFFGISFPDESGAMIYKAAVRESYAGEADQYGCETLVISRGDYLTETVKDWRKNIAMIGLTFGKLGDARKDAVPPVIEWYRGADVMCMLKVNTSQG